MTMCRWTAVTAVVARLFRRVASAVIVCQGMSVLWGEAITQDAYWVVNSVMQLELSGGSRVDSVIHDLEGVDVWVDPRKLGDSELFDDRANKVLPKIETNMVREILDSWTNPLPTFKPWNWEGRDEGRYKLDNMTSVCSQTKKSDSILLVIVDSGWVEEMSWSWPDATLCRQTATVSVDVVL